MPSPRWSARSSGTAHRLPGGALAPALVGLVGVGGAAVATARAVRSARPAPRPDRWHAVTVDRPLEEVAAALVLTDGTAGAPSGTLAAPLVALGDDVQVHLREAAGDHGTELRARATGEPSVALDARIRDALRRTRSLLETGEVVQPDENGTTRRTLTSLPLELAIRHGREAGRL